VIDGLSTRFEVIRQGENLGRVTIPTPGVHVALNFARGNRSCDGSRISFDARGVGARELLRNQPAIRDQGPKLPDEFLLDDYAHHRPKARDALRRARILQAPVGSRYFNRIGTRGLRDLFDEFLSAFDDADVLYCSTCIRPARSRLRYPSRRRYEALRARGHLEVHYLGADEDPTAANGGRIALGRRIATWARGDVYKSGGEYIEARSAPRAKFMKALETELRAKFGARVRAGMPLDGVDVISGSAARPTCSSMSRPNTELMHAKAAAYRASVPCFCLGAGNESARERSRDAAGWSSSSATVSRR